MFFHKIHSGGVFANAHARELQRNSGFRRPYRWRNAEFTQKVRVWFTRDGKPEATAEIAK